jgi:hypothetical protein
MPFDILTKVILYDIMFYNILSSRWRFGHRKKECAVNANVGTIDRTVRIVIGLGLIGAAVGGVIGVWGWIGVIPLGTALFGFCPAYRLVGLNTCSAAKRVKH